MSKVVNEFVYKFYVLLVFVGGNIISMKTGALYLIFGAFAGLLFQRLKVLFDLFNILRPSEFSPDGYGGLQQIGFTFENTFTGVGDIIGFCRSLRLISLAVGVMIFGKLRPSEFSPDGYGGLQQIGFTVENTFTGVWDIIGFCRSVRLISLAVSVMIFGKLRPSEFSPDGYGGLQQIGFTFENTFTGVGDIIGFCRSLRLISLAVGVMIFGKLRPSEFSPDGYGGLQQIGFTVENTFTGVWDIIGFCRSVRLISLAVSVMIFGKLRPSEFSPDGYGGLQQIGFTVENTFTGVWDIIGFCRSVRLISLAVSVMIFGKLRPSEFSPDGYGGLQQIGFTVENTFTGVWDIIGFCRSVRLISLAVSVMIFGKLRPSEFSPDGYGGLQQIGFTVENTFTGVWDIIGFCRSVRLISLAVSVMIFGKLRPSEFSPDGYGGLQQIGFTVENTFTGVWDIIGFCRSVRLISLAVSVMIFGKLRPSEFSPDGYGGLQQIGFTVENTFTGVWDIIGFCRSIRLISLAVSVMIFGKLRPSEFSPDGYGGLQQIGFTVENTFTGVWDIIGFCRSVRLISLAVSVMIFGKLRPSEFSPDGYGGLQQIGFTVENTFTGVWDIIGFCRSVRLISLAVSVMIFGKLRPSEFSPDGYGGLQQIGFTVENTFTGVWDIIGFCRSIRLISLAVSVMIFGKLRPSEFSPDGYGGLQQIGFTVENTFTGVWDIIGFCRSVRLISLAVSVMIFGKLRPSEFSPDGYGGLQQIGFTVENTFTGVWDIIGFCRSIRLISLAVSVMIFGKLRPSEFSPDGYGGLQQIGFSDVFISFSVINSTYFLNFLKIRGIIFGVLWLVDILFGVNIIKKLKHQTIKDNYYVFIFCIKKLFIIFLVLYVRLFLVKEVLLLLEEGRINNNNVFEEISYRKKVVRRSSGGLIITNNSKNKKTRRRERKSSKKTNNIIEVFKDIGVYQDYFKRRLCKCAFLISKTKTKMLRCIDILMESRIILVSVYCFIFVFLFLDVVILTTEYDCLLKLNNSILMRLLIEPIDLTLIFKPKSVDINFATIDFQLPRSPEFQYKWDRKGELVRISARFISFLVMSFIPTVWLCFDVPATEIQSGIVFNFQPCIGNLHPVARHGQIHYSNEIEVVVPGFNWWLFFGYAVCWGMSFLYSRAVFERGVFVINADGSNIATGGECFLKYYQVCVDKILSRPDLEPFFSGVFEINVGIFGIVAMCGLGACNKYYVQIKEVRYCFCLFSFVELMIIQWASGPNIIVFFLILELKTLTLASIFEFANDTVKNVFNCLTSAQIFSVKVFTEQLMRPLRDVIVQKQLSVSQMCKNLSFAANIVNDFCISIRSKNQLNFTSVGTRFFTSRYNAVVLLENEAVSNLVSKTFKQVVWESALWKKDAIWVSISESLLANDFRLNFNALPNGSKFSSSINMFYSSGKITTPISIEQIKSFHENFCLVQPNAPNVSNIIQIEPNVSNAPNVSNVSNAPSAPNVSNIIQIEPNVSNVSNAPSAPNVSNAPNIIQIEPNVSNAPSAPNVSNAPNIIQIEPNVSNAPSAPNVSNAPSAPNIIQIESGNLDNGGSRWWTILGLVVVVGVVSVSLYYYTGGSLAQYAHVGEIFDEYLKTQLEQK